VAPLWAHSFLLAAGSRIPKGNKTQGQPVDVAPTVLRLLGIDQDFHMDGKPMAAMVAQYLQK
jgi:arylsulfatase A-like enzyme